MTTAKRHLRNEKAYASMMTGPDDLSNRDLLDALIGFQTAVAEKFDRVDATIHSLQSDMIRRFDLIDNRFDEVDQRFAEVDKRFDRLEDRISKIEPKRKRPRDRE